MQYNPQIKEASPVISREASSFSIRHSITLRITLKEQVSYFELTFKVKGW